MGHVVKISIRSPITGSTFLKTDFLEGNCKEAAVDETTALHVGRSRVRFPMRTMGFFIHLILPAALWPGRRQSL